MFRSILSPVRTARLTALCASSLESASLRFVITGSSAAMLFFSLSVLAVKAGLHPFEGTLAAYGVAFVSAYTIQRAWTFRGRHRHRDALPRYLATQLCCALLSAALAHVLAEGGLPPLAMAAVTTFASSAASYLLSRYWVFPQHSFA